MKYAADFRYIAREALRGKWLIAVVVGLVASLLGGAGADGPELKLDIADPADEIIALAVVLTIDARDRVKGRCECFLFPVIKAYKEHLCRFS